MSFFFAECKDIISETVYAKSSSVQSQKNSWIKWSGRVKRYMWKVNEITLYFFKLVLNRY